MAVNLLAVFGTGIDQPIFVIIPIIYLSGFYLCTWLTYHTGCLSLGYVNGPVEGIVMTCLIYIVTGIFGRPFDRCVHRYHSQF